MPGTSVVTSSETGMSRHFWGRIKGAKYSFPLHKIQSLFSLDLVHLLSFCSLFRGEFL